MYIRPHTRATWERTSSAYGSHTMPSYGSPVTRPVTTAPGAHGGLPMLQHPTLQQQQPHQHAQPSIFTAPYKAANNRPPPATYGLMMSHGGMPPPPSAQPRLSAYGSRQHGGGGAGGPGGAYGRSHGAPPSTGGPGGAYRAHPPGTGALYRRQLEAMNRLLPESGPGGGSPQRGGWQQPPLGGALGGGGSLGGGCLPHGGGHGSSSSATMGLPRGPIPAPQPPPTAAAEQQQRAMAVAASDRPPPTPGPPQRMAVAARTIQGTYPGKTANQDSFLMQTLQPLRAGGAGAMGAGPGSPFGAPTATPFGSTRGRPPLSSRCGGGPSSLAQTLPPTSSAGFSLPSSPQRGGTAAAFDGELSVAAGGDAILGVYDGHGQHGHHVSKFIKERIALEVGRLGDSELADDTSAARELFNAHHRANEALKKSGIDCSLSGSTAVTCLKRGRRLLIANVGDSRAVLGRASADGRLVAKDLSIDQKPDDPAERARIEGGGGQVHPSIVPGAGYVGPARVWDPSRRFGLACARSMGDTMYYGPNRSGVIADPEVTTHRLDAQDKHIIIGSDGIWDRITSQEAVDIVRSCHDVETASERITQLARDRWRRNGPVADDITAVVVSLQ